MEATGLIERRRNPENGRGSVVALTGKGFDLIERIIAEHVANQHALVKGLTPEVQNQLDAHLKAWLAALGEGDAAIEETK